MPDTPALHPAQHPPQHPPLQHDPLTRADPRRARLETPPDHGRGELLAATESLCPTCLEPVDAEVRERDGEVWMDKRCGMHGAFSALLAADRAHYHLADPAIEAVTAGSSCCGPGRHCGDQLANHSCNVLVEVIQRCNLTCPTCYAGSSPAADGVLGLADFDALLDRLLGEAGKADMDVMQISGGEPTLHPDLPAMIDRALERGVRRVYVNTNGLRLADREFCASLAGRGDRFGVYLQLDGLGEEATGRLRGDGRLLPRKLQALANLEELGIETVPVITLAAGLNEHEVGPIIERAAASPVVHRLMIQPATYSGRYDNPRRVRRITVGDVARLAAEQTGILRSDDFIPIPCSDPNCFSMALLLRTPSGLLPVSRYFPRYETWAQPGVAELIGSVTETFDRGEDLRQVLAWLSGSEALAELPESALDGLLDLMAAVGSGQGGWSGMLAIGVKPFMDAWTYDRRRIDKCCVHVADPKGNPVSFCHYNAVSRPVASGLRPAALTPELP